MEHEAQHRESNATRGQVQGTEVKRVEVVKGVFVTFPNVYGPDIEHGVVWQFIQDEKQSRPGTVNPKGITIYGDGSQTRDFLHQSDMVRVIDAARDYEPGEYYGGTGIQTPVFQVFRLLTYIWGYTPKRDFVPLPEDEATPEVISTPGLDWHAKTLEEGLKLTVAAL